MSENLTPMRVMPRDLEATGLNFQSSIYVDRGFGHDLTAEFYSHERAQQVARIINEHPALLRVAEAAQEWARADSVRLATLPKTPEWAQAVARYLDAGKALNAAIAALEAAR